MRGGTLVALNSERQKEEKRCGGGCGDGRGGGGCVGGVGGSGVRGCSNRSRKSFGWRRIVSSILLEVCEIRSV